MGPIGLARRPRLVRKIEAFSTGFGSMPRVAMKVQDAMHKGVEWVSPETSVVEVAKLMCGHDVGAIPIGENDQLIGMVTDRDIVCRGLADSNFDARRVTARN